MLPVECLAPAEEDGSVLQHTYTLLVHSQRFCGLPDHEEKVNNTHRLASHCKHPLQRVSDSQTTTAECWSPANTITSTKLGPLLAALLGVAPATAATYSSPQI